MKAVLIHTDDNASVRQLFYKDIVQRIYTDWVIDDVSYYSLPLDYKLNTSPMWAIVDDNGEWLEFLRKTPNLTELTKWLASFLNDIHNSGAPSNVGGKE